MKQYKKINKWKEMKRISKASRAKHNKRRREVGTSASENQIKDICLHLQITRSSHGKGVKEEKHVRQRKWWQVV